MLRTLRLLEKLKPVLEEQTLRSFSKYPQVKILPVVSKHSNSDILSRKFHAGIISLKNKDEDDEEIKLPFYEFDKSEEKNKKSFLETVRLYESNFNKGGSHADFIKIALRNMEHFNVHKELEAYKALVRILPVDVYVANNRFLVDMLYHPKEQFVVMELLSQMAHFAVIPDLELGKMLVQRFGKLAHPCRIYYRLLYWTTKFKNKSPWLLPQHMPTDAFLLGKMAIERITSVDIQSQITVFQTENVQNAIDKTWIVSGQSPKQKELLSNHSPKTPVIVEGGDLVWLRDKSVNYFILKADSTPLPFHPPPPVHDLAYMESPYFNVNYKEKRKTYSVHEQDDGIIYAVCATGTSSKDSLLSWVRLLQEHGNPILGDVPVLFRFKRPTKEIVPASEALVHQ